MSSDHHAEDPRERELFKTIRQTYVLALEPEQRAMIRELRVRMGTVPAVERMALIDDIERSVGQNIEEELDF